MEVEDEYLGFVLMGVSECDWRWRWT